MLLQLDSMLCCSVSHVGFKPVFGTVSFMVTFLSAAVVTKSETSEASWLFAGKDTVFFYRTLVVMTFHEQART